MPTIRNSRKPVPPNLTIEEMLKLKPFEQLLADCDIYDTKDAAPLMGYHRNYVAQLCREKRIERIERRGEYFLYARTVHGAFKHCPPAASIASRPSGRQKR